MNIVISIVLSTLGTYLIVIGNIYLKNGCYRQNNNIFGNCKNIKFVDVTTLTNKYCTDKLFFDTSNVNCKIFGKYIYENKSYNCNIITNGNEYKNGTTYQMYINLNKTTKCYNSSHIKTNGLFGFLSVFFGSILLSVPIFYMLTSIMIKYLQNQSNKNDANSVDIQLSDMFTIEDTNDDEYIRHNNHYTKLNTDDLTNNNANNNTNNKIFRCNSNSSIISV